MTEFIEVKRPESDERLLVTRKVFDSQLEQRGFSLIGHGILTEDSGEAEMVSSPAFAQNSSAAKKSSKK